MLTGDNSQGNDRYKGYTKDLLDRLALDLGFNYTIQLVDVFGNEGVDGNWSGLIGKIVDMVYCSEGCLRITHILKFLKIIFLHILVYSVQNIIIEAILNIYRFHY